MNKHIVITIRYSLYAPEMRKSWVIGRDSEEDYKRELFSSERMSKRQSFFEKITLKSLIELNKNKPENVTLKVFLLTSNLLPKKNSDFLIEITKENKFLEVLALDQSNADVRSGLNEYVNSLDDQDIYASVRLDDDDALSPNFAKQMDHYLQPGFSGCVISFARGYGALLDESGNIKKLADYKWRFGSAGLAYISRKGKSVRTGRYSIYQCGNHIKTDDKIPTVSDGRSPAFIRAFHSENDSKDSFEKCVGKIFQPEEANNFLKEFGINSVLSV
ncbi:MULTISPECIES: glycosyltransferase [Pseudomonas]|uniref:glycosyltransferase n=1 Tax=Pseudomonas TaxID=286 RepID=UPI001BB053A1|nr:MULTISPECIES: glycosyltransferase [Pseudomonas]MBS4086641.1 hypothetical protein [Pseudomonas rustica]MEB0191010.1 glycosyltransferase [Pseudomonas sp. CCI1.1]WPX49366.1 glycosyltransferase [Pseudomonas sp. CCI1.1]